MKEIILKANKFDTKHFHLQTKIDSSGDRKIKGFASTRFPDRMNEIVSPKALEASMQLYLQNPVVLRDHDKRNPIGKMIDYQITPDGLYVTDQIAKGTQSTDETWSLIEQGVYRGLSIGFIPMSVNYDGEFPVIEELELIEHSIVSIPANRESLFSIAKAFMDGSDLVHRELKKLGLDKTLSEMEGNLRVIEENYKQLPEREQLRIDGIFKRLQTVCETQDLEIRTLEEEVDLLEQCVSLLSS